MYVNKDFILRVDYDFMPQDKAPMAKKKNIAPPINQTKVEV